MAKLSDETLMAYADGELPAAERLNVERELATDSDARARLSRFEASAAATRQAFDSIIAEPVPPHLTESIRQATRTTRREAPQAPGLWQRIRALMEQPLPGFSAAPGWAFALLVVFGLGLGVGWLAEPRPAREEFVELGPVIPHSALHVALETVPSGRGVAVGRGQFTGFVSFRDMEGRYCREFEVAWHEQQTDLLVGVACRSPAEQWAVEFSTEGHAASTGDGTMYAPSSARIHEAVDAFVERLLADEPLSAEEESALIQGGWVSSTPE